MTAPNYGTDLATIDDGHGNVDLTPGMVQATGRAVLSQSLIRRQTTPRGSVIDAPNECFDVRDWLNDAVRLEGGAQSARFQQLQSQIVQELRKDQRVKNVTVDIVYTIETKTLRITELVEAGDGPFTLTFSLSPDNITVLVADIQQRQ